MNNPKNRIRILVLSILGGLALCLMVFGGIVLLGPSAPTILKSSGGTPPAVHTLAPDSLYLGPFRTVQGTQYLVAEVNEVYRSSSSYSSARWFSYNSDSGGWTRNLVFMEGNNLKTHRLFDTNAYAITAVNQFPQPNLNEAQIQEMIQTGKNTADNLITVRSMVFQFIKKDTNQDGALTLDDLQTVGISDANGLGYAELFTNVNNVYWMEMTGPNDLVIVYSQEGQRKVSMIDITTRAVTQTKALVELGEEVK